MGKVLLLMTGIAIGIFLLGIFSLLFIETTAGYQRGQIDALSGHVVYCLEKQDNLELKWIYRSEGCKK